MAPFEIFDYDGEQVAVISLTTEITKITSSPDMGTTFSEEVAAAELAVTQVTELGVNKIVLVTHVGYDRDFDLANIDGVDVVVGGHSHSLLGDAAQVFPLGGEDGPYPTPQTRATDNGLVCIVQAWEYGHGVGMLSVEFDADGGVVSCTGNPVFPFDNANYDPPLDTETAAAVTAFLEGLEIFVAADGDPDTEAVLAPLTQAVLEFGNETIADVPEPGICYVSDCRHSAQKIARTNRSLTYSCLSQPNRSVFLVKVALRSVLKKRRARKVEGPATWSHKPSWIKLPRPTLPFKMVEGAERISSQALSKWWKPKLCCRFLTPW